MADRLEIVRDLLSCANVARGGDVIHADRIVVAIENLLGLLGRLEQRNEELTRENRLLNMTLFCVNDGLSSPDESVCKMIEAAYAAQGAAHRKDGD